MLRLALPGVLAHLERRRRQGSGPSTPICADFAWLVCQAHHAPALASAPTTAHIGDVASAAPCIAARPPAWIDRWDFSRAWYWELVRARCERHPDLQQHVSQSPSRGYASSSGMVRVSSSMSSQAGLPNTWCAPSRQTSVRYDGRAKLCIWILCRAADSQTEDAAVLAAVRTGDEGAFAALAERYRRQLHVLATPCSARSKTPRTWCRRPCCGPGGPRRLRGPAQFRTWLYRIATNACLNALTRTPRRLMPPDVQVRHVRSARRVGRRLRDPVAAAFPGPPARAGRAGRGRAAQCGRLARDHRAGVSGGHPAPAAPAAGDPDPARRPRCRRRRRPTCSTRAWPPSIAPSSAPARRMRARLPQSRLDWASASGLRATRSAPSSSATWRPTTARTQPPWPPCCARTPA